MNFSIILVLLYSLVNVELYLRIMSKIKAKFKGFKGDMIKGTAWLLFATSIVLLVILLDYLLTRDTKSTSLSLIGLMPVWNTGLYGILNQEKVKSALELGEKYDDKKHF